MGLCSRARGAPQKRPLVSCGLVLIMTLSKLIKEVHLCCTSVLNFYSLEVVLLSQNCINKT